MSITSVSIIIATSGRATDLKCTLESLAGLPVPNSYLVELIVVENAIRSGAEDIVYAIPFDRISEVRYLYEPTRGKSNALNFATANAGGEILLFSDDDVRFPKNWIEGMCDPIREGRADAVAGGVRLAAALLRPWMDHTHRAWLASTADYLSPENPSEMCGANMAISRSAFSLVGKFDSELGPGITGGGEESLLSRQLSKMGCRILGQLGVAVEHYFSPDRLCYGSWIKAANHKGVSRAYIAHHFSHIRLHLPELFSLYYWSKLAVRRLLFRKRQPTDEGISSWELSYLESWAFYSAYCRQRSRRPNYDRLGRRLVPL